LRKSSESSVTQTQTPGKQAECTGVEYATSLNGSWLECVVSTTMYLDFFRKAASSVLITVTVLIKVIINKLNTSMRFV